MKAIILEVKDGCAAALREDGVVVKTRQTGEIGTTIELNETAARPSQGGRILRMAIAASLALAVTGGAYTYTNVAAASYVTLDTEEASVELSVNRMGRVVGVRAMDDGSEALAEALYADVRRLSVEDAVDRAMARMGGAQTLVAGVTGETEEHTARLQETVERCARRSEREGTEFIALEVSREERREAGERDMSAGRWAFERVGGFWRDAERDDPGDVDDLDDSDALDGQDGLDDDGSDGDAGIRPAFGGTGVPPAPPTENGAVPEPPSGGNAAPAPPQTRAGEDDDRDAGDGDGEDDDDDDKDDEDDDDGGAWQPDGQTPPAVPGYGQTPAAEPEEGAAPPPPADGGNPGAPSGGAEGFAPPSRSGGGFGPAQGGNIAQ